MLDNSIVYCLVRCRILEVKYKVRNPGQNASQWPATFFIQNHQAYKSDVVVHFVGR